ncbi:hypothetical protein [Rhodomicrobium lacus]|uniref:hypothetical protein n=1 Tax=Rhodomicrobium lacus TaxID=2498452 RepID=UPI000F8CF04C|nr:hypothetical protein [Rhodomicrobium lacus]
MHSAAEAGVSLAVWQGWGVISVMAALIALLATVLAWLLPFPDRALSSQLASYPDRIALKDRLGAASPFNAWLVTVRRLGEWLDEWFGAPFSGQAFERCLAIAFIFPISLLTLTLITNGIAIEKISWLQVLVFAAAFAVIASVILVAFRNLVRLIEHAWTTFGGDKALAQTISRLVLGGFAFMIAFSIAFAVASAFSGHQNNATSVLGAMAGGFALAFALTMAFALAGAVLFSITVAVLAGAALAFASEFTFLLFLFFILLPITNASVDWLSWAVTRSLIRKEETAEPNLKGRFAVIGVVAGTFLSGVLLMIVLALLLPNTLEVLNLALTSADLPRFNWEALMNKALYAPWSEGLFVTGMLMTPLVPAAVHLIIGLTGVLARFTPGARTAAQSISDHPEVGLTEQEQGPVKITLILARLWYLVAAAATVAVITGTGALLSLTHAPVGQFLSNAALCATSWSHGKCGWL